jgi:ribonuclease HI
MNSDKELLIEIKKNDHERDNNLSNCTIFKIFTDGSNTDQSKTLKNKHLRRGGIGVYHPDSDTKISEPFPLENPTNNRAEYWACIRALEWVLEIIEKHELQKQVKIKVILYTDSMLVINSMTKWLSGWKKKNWKKSDGKPVLNQELIVKLDHLISNRLPLTTFVKVKAHQKKPTDQKMLWLWKGNFIADKLANEGRMIAEEK